MRNTKVPMVRLRSVPYDCHVFNSFLRGLS